MGLKETVTVKDEKGTLDAQNSTGRKQTAKTTQLQKHAIIHEKGRMTQRQEPRAQGTNFEP